MRSINKVILIGNLTRDPELRETSGGQKIATFGIATNREWTSNGERKESAEFHEVAAWAKLGEICHQYLKKGKLVYVEGYLKTHVQTLENGEKKHRTEIVIQDMVMLERRADNHSADNSSAANNSADETPVVEEPEEMGAPVEGDNIF